MSLAQEFDAASDRIFIQRVQMAMIAFAINVVETEDPATTNHPNRASFATKIVNNPQLYAAALAGGVIALNAASDGATLTDVIVANSVATIWNIYSGIV